MSEEPIGLDAIVARRERAMQELGDICAGRRRWTMCVPVQPDDSDILLAASLRDVLTLVAHIKELRARLDDYEERRLP